MNPLNPQQLSQAIGQMTPTQLVELRRLLGVGDGTGPAGTRSPIRPRQLTDLRLLPTADDPRPTFFMSTETPRDWIVGPGTPFPRLRWHAETGEEITVQDPEHLALKARQGYTLDTPLAAVVADPVLDLSRALAGLPEAEQRAILAAQGQQRTATLTAQLAALPPDELERLVAALNLTSAKKKTA